MGAWTPQEVAYATRVADLYRAGSLPNVPDGITLRILLSKLLNCQPMRVSKKYSGESWSHHGKRPYCHVAAPDQRVVEELWLLGVKPLAKSRRFSAFLGRRAGRRAETP